jgi:selenocysteine lyase/cysteine desulfurase
LLLGLPWERALQAFRGAGVPWPSAELLTSDPERYWAELRSQWLLSENHVNLNCGTLGCTPLPVLRAVIEHLLAAETYREPDYPWFGYEEKPILRELRDGLATFLNCDRDELALVRNATEGNNTFCNGLDLNAGDEVLLTDQEHPSGRCCWEQRAARHGLRLRFVTLPEFPASSGEILDRFARALTPGTRVMVFSHISSPTGLILPVRELCDLARERGILTHIDGAHAVGQIPVDLRAIGCDSYTTSTHKWLMAPKGTGILFIREAIQDCLWVNTASSRWRDRDLKAYRFSNLGSSNLSLMVGLKAALDFVQAIGPQRVYDRIHALARSLRHRLAGCRALRLITPEADALYGGLVSFAPADGDLQPLLAACAARRIRIAGSPRRIRLSTHLFNQPAELEAFLDAVDHALGRHPK